MLGFRRNDFNKAKAIFGVFSIFASFITSVQGISYYLENIINDIEPRVLISMFLSGLFIWAIEKVNTDWKNF